MLYCDMGSTFDALPNEIAGQLIKLIFDYVRDKNPTPEDLLLKVAFEPIKNQLKRDLQKWNEFIEKQRVNGERGGRPKKPKETQITQAFISKPKKADNVTVTVTDTVNDNNIPPTPYEGASALPELSAQIAEFQKSNPTKYPKEMYERFQEYWGAPVISGRGLGKPLWRTQKTWVLTGRLATWNGRNKPQTTTSERKFDRV